MNKKEWFAGGGQGAALCAVCRVPLCAVCRVLLCLLLRLLDGPAGGDMPPSSSPVPSNAASTCNTRAHVRIGEARRGEAVCQAALLSASRGQGAPGRDLAGHAGRLWQR